MASMASGKTPNLGLSQWAAEDYIRREDFNSDFAAIDAALADVGGIEFIKEVSTSADAAQVDVDVSDIDWSKYHEVYVDVIHPMEAKDISTSYGMRFNDLANTNDYSVRISGASQTNMLYAGFMYVNIPDDKHQRIVFMPYKDSDRKVALWLLSGTANISSKAMSLSFRDFNTFNLVTTSSGKVIYQSTTFKIWGVK